MIVAREDNFVAAALLRLRVGGKFPAHRLAHRLEYAALQLHAAAAELADQRFRMAGEDDDRGAVKKAFDALVRLLAEGFVAGADAFVDQENIALRRGGDGKGQPREHAGRIGSQRQRQEITQFGEVGDLVELGCDLTPVHAQHVAAQINVLDSGRFEIHAGGRIEQRADIAFDGDGAAARLVDAGEHAQQRRLARTVVADETDAVAVIDLEVEAVDGTHGDDVAGIRHHATAGRLRQDLVFQRAGACAKDRELDRQVLDGDVRHAGYTRSMAGVGPASAAATEAAGWGSAAVVIPAVNSGSSWFDALIRSHLA